MSDIRNFEELIDKINRHIQEVAYLTAELREQHDKTGPTERLDFKGEPDAEDVYDWLVEAAAKHGIPGTVARMRVRIYGPKGSDAKSTTCHVPVSDHATIPEVAGQRVDKEAELLFLLDQQRRTMTFVSGIYQRALVDQRDATRELVTDVRAYSDDVTRALFTERRGAQTAMNELIDRRITEAEKAEERAAQVQAQDEDRELIETTVQEVVSAATTLGMAYIGVPPEAKDILPELLAHPKVREALTNPKLRDAIKDRTRLDGLAEMIAGAVE